jgi:hypothetical protein
VKTDLEATLMEKEQRLMQLDNHNRAKARELYEAQSKLNRLQRDKDMSASEVHR